MKKLFATIAASAMVLASSVAQANTRASEASVALDRAAMPMAQDQAIADDDDEGIGLLPILLVLLILGGVAAVVGGDVEENDASFGTGG